MMITTSPIHEQLQDLLQEGREGALQRERTAFDEAVGPRGASLVLFGAGGMGCRVLAGLRKLGIEPLAFADNNQALWGAEVNGVPVISPTEAVSRYSRTAAFVVTIWCGEGHDRMCDRVGLLHGLGCSHVAHFGQLFWKYPEVFLPYYAAAPAHQVHEQAAAVLDASGLWADEASRQEYLSQIRWRLFFDFDGLADPSPHAMYFPPDLRTPISNEVFVDCGAYDGDTIRSFLAQAHSGFEKIIAFEPDPSNFRKLSSLVSTLPCRDSIEIHQAATGSENGTVLFSDDGSKLSSVGSGSLKVQCVALDDALRGAIPTHIKMDIEGAEMEALQGARRLIRQHAPMLSICCYHQQDHLWKIPQLIRSIRPDYHFFLRPHLIEVWDLVCYAIPSGRLVNGL